MLCYPCTVLTPVLTQRAETPECWITKFQLDSIFSYNFGHIKLSGTVLHDLSANVASSWNSSPQHSGVSARLVLTSMTPQVSDPTSAYLGPRIWEKPMTLPLDFDSVEEEEEFNDVMNMEVRKKKRPKGWKISRKKGLTRVGIRIRYFFFTLDPDLVGYAASDRDPEQLQK